MREPPHRKDLRNVPKLLVPQNCWISEGRPAHFRTSPLATMNVMSRSTLRVQVLKEVGWPHCNLHCLAGDRIRIICISYCSCILQAKSIEVNTGLGKSATFRQKSSAGNTPKLLTRVEQLRLLSKVEDAGLLSLGAEISDTLEAVATSPEPILQLDRAVPGRIGMQPVATIAVSCPSLVIYDRAPRAYWQAGRVDMRVVGPAMSSSAPPDSPSPSMSNRLSGEERPQPVQDREPRPPLQG